MDPAAESISDAEPPTGPQRLLRLMDEPDWLCDGAYLDEFGRTWLCGRIKHGGTHQAWLWIGIDGDSQQVDHADRLEWLDW